MRLRRLELRQLCYSIYSHHMLNLTSEVAKLISTKVQYLCTAYLMEPDSRESTTHVCGEKVMSTTTSRRYEEQGTAVAHFPHPCLASPDMLHARQLLI